MSHDMDKYNSDARDGKDAGLPSPRNEKDITRFVAGDTIDRGLRRLRLRHLAGGGSLNRQVWFY